MQPFMFRVPANFDCGELAAAVGGKWRRGCVVRGSTSMSLKDGGATLLLGHCWNWPWRWAAAGRLEADLLAALVSRGVEPLDEFTREVFQDLRAGR